MTTDNKDRVIGWLLVATCSAIIAVMLLSGCAQPRITTETYWPGDPPVVAVEWPQGTAAADVQVFEVEGRAIAVGAVESVY
jgi:hypothetical protein